MPVKLPVKASYKQSPGEPVQETLLKEQDVINTNYLSSAQYIFKSVKKKRQLVEDQK